MHAKGIMKKAVTTGLMLIGIAIAGLGTMGCDVQQTAAALRQATAGGSVATQAPNGGLNKSNAVMRIIWPMPPRK